MQYALNYSGTRFLVNIKLLNFLVDSVLIFHLFDENAKKSYICQYWSLKYDFIK